MLSLKNKSYRKITINAYLHQVSSQVWRWNELFKNVFVIIQCVEELSQLSQRLKQNKTKQKTQPCSDSPGKPWQRTDNRQGSECLFKTLACCWDKSLLSCCLIKFASSLCVEKKKKHSTMTDYKKEGWLKGSCLPTCEPSVCLTKPVFCKCFICWFICMWWHFKMTINSLYQMFQ